MNNCPLSFKEQLLRSRSPFSAILSSHRLSSSENTEKSQRHLSVVVRLLNFQRAHPETSHFRHLTLGAFIILLLPVDWLMFLAPLSATPRGVQMLIDFEAEAIKGLNSKWLVS
jgi:hypothetical protein